MKKQILPIASAVLFLAVPLNLTSCSSTPKGTTSESKAFKAGVPGGTFIQTFESKAIVTAIDPAARKVTLANEAGHEVVFTAGPAMVNFDQLRVGDQIHVKVIQKAVVAMATDATPQTDNAAVMAVLAPEGAEPAGMLAASVQVTARVTAIDPDKHTATLQFPDGNSETFPVRKDVDLTQRKAGEEVSIQLIQAIVIDTTKP